MSVANGVRQIGFVDDATASDVDDAHARLGLDQRGGVQQVRRLLRLRKVNRNEVALREQSVQIDQLDAHVSRPFISYERVKGNQAHAEGRRALGDERADLAETHDTEGLAVKFNALPLAALPFSGLQRRMSLGNIASLRQQQRHGLFRRGENIRDRRVDDHYSQLGGLGDVDVVQSNSGASDDDEVLRRFKRRSVNLGRRANDECVGTGQGLNQLSRRESQSNVHVVARVAQFLKTGVSNLFGYQYTSHKVTFR